VDVVEYDDERSVSSERLQQLAHRPIGLLDRGTAPREPDHACNALSNERRLRLAGQEGLNPREYLIRGVVFTDPGGVLHDLGHWPEGDPFPIREAPPANQSSAVPGPSKELPGQAGLADTRRTDERDERADALPLRPAQDIVEDGEFSLAADQG
jgi:hypothetical protein